MSITKGATVMSFGYLPRRKLWKDLFSRIIGVPNFIRRIQAPVLMRLLSPKQNDVILDAGCGSGHFSYELSKMVKFSVGIDFETNKELSFITTTSPNVSYLKGDLRALPFKLGKFDKVLLSSVLQLVENDKKLLKDLHQVIAKDGTLVLSVPLRYSYFEKLNQLRPLVREKFGSNERGKRTILQMK